MKAPEGFDALAAVGAHLPIVEEQACQPSHAPVSLLLVSGTDDPINPWKGGAVRAPGAGTVGLVMSAEATASSFVKLAGAPDEARVERHADRDAQDGATAETRRWTGPGGHEIMLVTVRGGGHTLPHPAAAFPAEIVGRTCRDLDGAAAIWAFFERAGARSPRTGAARR